MVLGSAAWYQFLGDGQIMNIRPAPTPTVAVAASAQILPAYAIRGGLDVLSETTRRPLFNPTRPAPSATKGSEDRPDLRAGGIVFLGASIWGDRRVALLRVAREARTRIVEGGERVGRVTVVLINADRITIRVGDQTQELRFGAAAGGNADVALQRLTSPGGASTQAAPSPPVAAAINPINSVESDTALRIAEGTMAPNPP